MSTAGNIDPPAADLSKRVAGQGALLFSGFASAQALSFARNAIIGHWLSKGDFGIAATLTLILQLLETLTDLGADRMIVQAKDGEAPRFIATSHLALVLRGVLTAAAIYLLAAPAAHFFQIEEARSAFEAIAAVPLLKGFMSLDPRRAQRRLDNWPQLAIEVIPQAAVLALTIPVLMMVPGYWAIVWLSLIQAILTVATTHAIAERGYRLAFDRAILARLISFGWPIWLSAFPLILVYQGDRVLIGRYYGMEALAGYSVAFMVTMVPGLMAAKVGNALMLPLFADARQRPHALRMRLAAMTEVTAFAAALYLTAFVLTGGGIVPIAFGEKYQGLGMLTAALAIMWAIRMLQAVPGMALIAEGTTRPLLTAGLLRSLALAPALALAWHGAPLEWIAAMGIPGELLSMLYLTHRLEALNPGLGRAFLVRAALIVPAGLGALGLAAAMSADESLMTRIPAALLASGCVTGLAAATLPALRAYLRTHLGKPATAADMF